jgi:hypothetical protein
MQDSKLREFSALFQRFASSYPKTPGGLKHVQLYTVNREEGRTNYGATIAAHQRGEDVQEAVLLKLLPYSDSKANRQRGAWVHNAPVFAGDLKTKFEGAGWTKPEDWPRVAEAILTFVRHCTEKPAELDDAVTKFLKLPYSRGFQAGTLTPILNALRPDDFALVNNKSRLVINYFADTACSQSLRDYPATNEAAHRLVRELSRVMHQFQVPSMRDDDLFDMFCHWLVAVEIYDFAAGNGPSEGTGTKVIRESHGIAGQGPIEAPTEPSYFTEETFELLGKLSQSPTKDVYSQNKEAFRTQLEVPFKALFAEVTRRLPKAVLETMETEKGLFSRILKNDYGQGGAWDFYWGAFYPRQSKRTDDAQLYASISKDALRFGFSTGARGETPRERFWQGIQANRSTLTDTLMARFDGYALAYGQRAAPESSCKVWLRNPQPFPQVEMILSKQEILDLSREELVTRVVDVFALLFPLVILTISGDPLPAIERYAGIGEKPTAQKVIGETPTVHPGYALQDCAQECGLDEFTLRRWIGAIERKKQAILYGPPGTGKTFIAKKLAQCLVSATDGFWEVVQFHPAYAYEDFVQGIRPQRGDQGQLDYPVMEGRFLRFCREAATRSGPCVLIIDEINRANLARIFGELMYLLEYREEKVHLAVDGREFSISENVRLIGTMNTADRSIALVDHALRRRFAFIGLAPNYDVLQGWHQQHTGFRVDGLLNLLRRLNRDINDPNYEVGISFFLVKEPAKQLEDIWRMEIEPYLEEYFFDRRDAVDPFRWDKVKAEVLA